MPRWFGCTDMSTPWSGRVGVAWYNQVLIADFYSFETEEVTLDLGVLIGPTAGEYACQ
jgi:hypothetical protein